MHRLRATTIVVCALVLLGTPLLTNSSLGIEHAEAQSAPPEPPIVDNFNRPDENPLSDSGRWTSLGNPLQVVSDQMAGTWAFASGSWRNDVRYVLDQDVMITLAWPGGDSDRIRLHMRMQLPSISNGYAVEYRKEGGTDSVKIYRFDNGSETTLATFAQDFAAGDKLRGRAVGSTIEAWRFDSSIGSWVKLGEATDSTYVGIGYVSIAVVGDQGRYDDFGAATLRTPAPYSDPPPIDNFNRPDENPLSDAGRWSGGLWSPMRVISNRVAGTESGLNGTWRNDVSYAPDQEVWTTIETGPEEGGSIRLLMRLQPPGSLCGYGVRLQSRTFTDDVVIERANCGGFTTLLTLNQEFMQGDKLRARVVGSTIQAWRYNNNTAEWGKLGETSDSTFAGGGHVGIVVGGAIARYDDFGAANISPPGPPVGQSNGTTGERGLWGLTGTTTVADPVNTRTGFFVHQEDDLATPGTGVPFAWTRSYTSGDATVGPLGPGWTHTYAASLSVQGNGDVLARGEEGQEVYFTKQGSSFVGAAGALADLASVAGGYELKRSDQVVYAFNSSGRLLSIKDRNNQGVTLAYDGQGRLGTITDAAGKQVTVAYNASNLVSTVSTQDGRSVSYGYTSGRLTSVTDVRGKNWTYAYDAGGRLESITDPLTHRQVFNVYDANGRVQTQTDAMNRRRPSPGMRQPRTRLPPTRTARRGSTTTTTASSPRRSTR